MREINICINQTVSNKSNIIKLLLIISEYRIFLHFVFVYNHSLLVSWTLAKGIHIIRTLLVIIYINNCWFSNCAGEYTNRLFTIGDSCGLIHMKLYSTNNCLCIMVNSMASAINTLASSLKICTSIDLSFAFAAL